MKKTWDTKKEVTVKTKTKNLILRRMVIYRIETFDQNKKWLMDLVDVSLKSNVNMHPQFQPLPKISNSSWVSLQEYALPNE